MATLSGVARRHPKTAYAGLQKSLHQEWDFVQHVNPEIGMAFQVVDYVLRDIFLPDLFQGDTSQIPGIEITGLPVKQAGISLLNSSHTVGENWTASCIRIRY